MSEKSVSEQEIKTLERRFWGIAGASNSLTVSEAKSCVREWLQQKKPKLKEDYTWNEGWSYDQKTIKKLLEDLDK